MLHLILFDFGGGGGLSTASAACLNTSLTPSPSNEEHSRNNVAPTLCRSCSPSSGLSNGS